MNSPNKLSDRQNVLLTGREIARHEWKNKRAPASYSNRKQILAQSSFSLSLAPFRAEEYNCQAAALICSLNLHIISN